jgi:hypothetical protein
MRVVSVDGDSQNPREVVGAAAKARQRTCTWGSAKWRAEDRWDATRDRGGLKSAGLQAGAGARASCAGSCRNDVEDVGLVDGGFRFLRLATPCDATMLVPLWSMCKEGITDHWGTKGQGVAFVTDDQR